jgi:hypothetical protein
LPDDRPIEQFSEIIVRLSNSACPSVGVTIHQTDHANSNADLCRTAMNTTKLTRMLAVTATAFSLAASIHSAQVSFSAKAPTLGPNDISNLKGASTDTDNVNEGDHNATYLADDRPIQGQTFTTGTNAAGYQVRAVTLREVKHETYALVPYLKYAIRIIQPSGNTLEIIATETAEVAAAVPGNIPSIGDGGEMGSGSGAFVTFTFDKPVTLKPNTRYGFDIGAGSARHYWQTDGTFSDAYTGGEAYSSGTAGAGDSKQTSRTGDRVFVVALTRVSAPVASQTKASPQNKP